MSGVAAHLVDRVLPDVPLRQWVATFPWELRRLAAFRAAVTPALYRRLDDPARAEKLLGRALEAAPLHARDSPDVLHQAGEHGGGE